jgi:two-component system nitrogen regulation response regulator GlnG
MEHFLTKAAAELQVESKRLLPETTKKLQALPWPGNVRQLENTARWLTVMASGQDVHVEDLPEELVEEQRASSDTNDWQGQLRQWAKEAFQQGEHALLDEAVPLFERIMVETALEQTGGRKQDASKLLGWGRNTLTRKLKELGIDTQNGS